MMNEREKILSWETPVWHADCGDPEKEMGPLKKLCLYMVDIGMPYTFELNCFEPGYIMLEIYKGGTLFATMYVVDADEGLYGLFMEDDGPDKDEDYGEYYFHKERILQSICRALYCKLLSLQLA
jgi:hypothetical protein